MEYATAIPISVAIAGLFLSFLRIYDNKKNPPAPPVLENLSLEQLHERRPDCKVLFEGIGRDLRRIAKTTENNQKSIRNVEIALVKIDKKITLNSKE